MKVGYPGRCPIFFAQKFADKRKGEEWGPQKNK